MHASRTALGLGLALALAAPAAAQATPKNDSYAVNVASQTHDLGSYGVNGFTNLQAGWVFYHLGVTSRATWTGTLSTVTSWTPPMSGRARRCRSAACRRCRAASCASSGPFAATSAPT